MKLHIWEGRELAPVPAEAAVADSPAGWVWQHQEPLVLSDLRSDIRFLPDLNLLKEKGIRSYCTLPLTTAQKRLGALGLGSTQVDAYREKDLRLLPRVAELVAVAVENALTREALQQEKDRLQMLLEVNTTLVSNRELEQLFPAISMFMRRMINHDYASVAIYDEAAHSLSLYPLDSPLNQGIVAADATVPVRETPAGKALLEREAKIFNREDLARTHSRFVDQMLHQGIRSLCCIPLLTRKGTVGTLNLASKEDHAFDPRDIELLKQVAAQVAIALDNARAYREIAELTGKRKTVLGR